MSRKISPELKKKIRKEVKKDVAVQFFLENVRRRIISYHEFKQITRVFDTTLCKREKDVFLGKNKNGKSSKNKKSERSSLLENDGSLAFFHIHHYRHTLNYFKPYLKYF